MKTTLRLRILVDTEGESNVFRDIEVPSDYTFEDLHNTIQNQFGFDNSQMASFYESDEDWERGDEIMLMDMRMDEKEEIRLMQDTKLGSILSKPHQKMLYIFDFLVMWTFFIEVVSVGEFNKSATYPLILLSVGDAPDQYSKTAEDLFGAMKSELLIEDEDDEDEDEDYFDEFGMDEDYPSY